MQKHPTAPDGAGLFSVNAGVPLELSIMSVVPPGYDIAMFVCRPECDKSLVDDLNATPDAFSVLVVR